MRSALSSKFFSAIIVLIFSALQLSAQTANITGKILGNNKEPLIGAVAELRNVADSSLAKASVADLDGKYNLEAVKPGSYYIRTSFLGFNPYKSAVFSFDGTATKSMPDIVMEQSAVMLKGAEVSAFKPLVEVKADKTVFNVESSINATGSNALELLQKAPGVVVDNNDNITLKGQGGVMVQIDGRPSRMTEAELADYLRSIQSTDVEAIEMMSNPSSKYDAEGTAGIINIKLKKNKNYGTNGSLTAGYSVGRYSKYNAGLSLNSRTKKFNVYGNFGYNWGERSFEFDLYREQRPYIFTAKTVTRRAYTGYNFKGGIDYTINKKNSIGVMLNGNVNESDGSSNGKNFISNYFTGAVDSILKSDQTFVSDFSTFTFNINHQYKDTTGRELITDFDYSINDNDRNTYVPNVYVTPEGEFPLSSTFYRSVTPTTINIFSLKSDYTQKLFKGKLGAGYKVSLVNTDNTFNFFNINGFDETLDPTRSNRFEYQENVYALYLNYQKTFGKLDAQVGIRMETTESEGDLSSETIVENKNVERSYTDFFPSAGLTWNVHKNHAVAALYSSRIDRPNYGELNPFENKLDELSYRKGNPFLDPQYSDKVELSHTFKYATTTSISYSKTNDYFAQITDTIPGGISYMTPRNLATEEVLSLNFSTSQQITKWYSFYLNASLNNQKYQADFGENKTIDNDVIAFNFYSQNSFKLPWGFTFEVSGWFNSGGVWGGSYESEPQGALDLGLQKKLFSDQATLKVSVTDVFETAPWDSRNTYGGIVSRASGNWESQQLRVNFTWRFGNKQIRAIRQRTTGSESEMKRIGGGE